jgi:hypothetical protein
MYKLTFFLIFSLGLSAQSIYKLNVVNCTYKKNTIMNFKDFIYNKETKKSNLLGVLFVVVVTIITVAVVYWTTKL